jgi:hypothetical protein
MGEWQDDYLQGFSDGYHAAVERNNFNPEAFNKYLPPGVTPIRVTKKTKVAPEKKKRKASAYSKRYGAAYKSLKAKHPRMSFGALSKKAHKQARRK